MNTEEVMWGLVKDNFEQARAHEQYRANVSMLVVSLTTVLVGILTAKNGIPVQSSYVYALIAVIGIYGGLLNAKHYERFRMHIHIANKYLSLMKEQDLISIDVTREFAKIQLERKWKHSRLASIDLNWFWTGFPLGIAVFGLFGAICSA